MASDNARHTAAILLSDSEDGIAAARRWLNHRDDGAAVEAIERAIGRLEEAVRVIHESTRITGR